MSFAILLLEGFVAVAAAVHFASILAVALRARSDGGARLSPKRTPGVSILRPVRGVENHIEETLRSAFRLSYPSYEILFCVASGQDRIVPVVERLITEFPQIPARLLVGDERISINPKLNNLAKGWTAARYDWIVMADSNVLMPSDYLERLFAPWDGRTGLVCSPPVGAAPAGFWAELECAFLNTFQARWQLAADAAGLGFAQGKTMLWRRDILDQAGGIEALGREAAEDAAGTKIVRDRGLKVRLVPRPFPQPLGKRRLAEVWERQLRWARLRKVSFKPFFLPELVAGGFFPFCAGSVLVAAGAAPPAALAVLAVAWYGAEGILARTMRWPLNLRSPAAWLLRDCMLPWLWIAAMSGSGFVWRGNAMDVRRVALVAADMSPVED